jgi:membrane protein
LTALARGLRAPKPINRYVDRGEVSGHRIDNGHRQSLARWPILLAAVGAGLAVLYRYGPSRTRAEWTWVTPGGLMAAVLWLVISMLFSWYVANSGSYNETYGLLGALIGLTTWIRSSGIVVRLGTEINAEIEHQTTKDTTVGPPKPVGRRGATMADTLGATKI